MTKVTISVVCPTFNSAEFIEKTLNSVIHQSRRPDEVIVADDGSSDRSFAVVSEFALGCHC